MRKGYLCHFVINGFVVVCAQEMVEDIRRKDFLLRLTSPVSCIWSNMNEIWRIHSFIQGEKWLRVAKGKGSSFSCLRCKDTLPGSICSFMEFFKHEEPPTFSPQTMCALLNVFCSSFMYVCVLSFCTLFLLKTKPISSEDDGINQTCLKSRANIEVTCQILQSIRSVGDRKAWDGLTVTTLTKESFVFYTHQVSVTFSI